MEENSGVKFQHAMVALSRQWVGQENGKDQPQSVSIVLPDETNSSGAAIEGSKEGGNKSQLKTETYPLPQSVDEARAIIERFEQGADGLRSDESVSDNVVQHMLTDRTSLLDEQWLGTPEEEKNAYVSELLYIHSKVMIVDDRRVIVSQFQIYRQSLLTTRARWVQRTSTTVARRCLILYRHHEIILIVCQGDGDSEIALVVEDEDLIETTMDGQKYLAGRFAASLRRKLYRGASLSRTSPSHRPTTPQSTSA